MQRSARSNRSADRLLGVVILMLDLTLKSLESVAVIVLRHVTNWIIMITMPSLLLLPYWLSGYGVALVMRRSLVQIGCKASALLLVLNFAFSTPTHHT